MRPSPQAERSAQHAIEIGAQVVTVFQANRHSEYAIACIGPVAVQLRTFKTE